MKLKHATSLAAILWILTGVMTFQALAGGTFAPLDIAGTWTCITPENERLEYVFAENGNATWTIGGRLVRAKYEARARGANLIEIDMFDFDLPQLAGVRFLGLAKATGDVMILTGVPVKDGKTPDGQPANRPGNVGKDAVTLTRVKQK